MKMVMKRFTALTAALCIAATGAATAGSTALPFAGFGTAITASASGVMLNEDVISYFKGTLTDDMTDMDKANAICDFLCKVGTTPETENLEMYYTPYSNGEKIYLNLNTSKDFSKAVYALEIGAELGIDTNFATIENDNNYKAVFIIDGKTYFAELKSAVSGARSYTIREVTDEAEKFTYDNGTITGYIGEIPADGILRLPAAQPNGTLVQSVDVDILYQQIKEVVIPEGVLQIFKLDSCFLEKINIPASVNYIANGAFLGNMALDKIDIAPANTNFTFKDNVLYSIYQFDDSGIVQKLALFAVRNSYFKLADDTTEIAGGFLNETYYSPKQEDPSFEIPYIEVTIPASVSYIADEAFVSDNLVSVTIEKGKLRYINERTFVSDNLDLVVIPASVKEIFDDAFVSANKFIIEGAHDTAAEDYANRTGLTFNASVEDIDSDDEEENYDLSNADVSVEPYNEYNGEEQTPDVYVYLGGKQLTNGIDFEVTYSDNVNAGSGTATVKGINIYKGEQSVHFDISQAPLSSKNVKLSRKASMSDSGKVTSSKIKVYSPVTGAVLTEGTDYKITAKNDDLEKGISTFTIKGLGNYTGTLKLKANARASVKYATVKLSATKFYYNGKAKKPGVTVKLGGKTLVKGTDYKVKYGNNKATGKAAIRITGIGKYSGMTKAYFYIRPQKTTIKNVTSPKAKQVKVTWKRLSTSDGYKVVIADNSSFTGSKTYYVGSYTTTSKTIKKLTSGKTYYVKTAAYKTINGKKYFGKTSDVKSVVCR